jgi:hypothetical protein
VHRFEDAQIAVELVLGCVVSDRPSGADLERARARLMDDAMSVAEELNQVLDEIGVVEMNRCHLPQMRPGVAAAGSHISLSSTPVGSQEQAARFPRCSPQKDERPGCPWPSVRPLLYLPGGLSEGIGPSYFYLWSDCSG